MNISLENIDKVSAVLTIKMEKADYADRVEKALKDFRRKASMPGFRGSRFRAKTVSRILTSIRWKSFRLLSIWLWLPSSRLN